MWKYWKEKYGVAEALTYFPKILEKYTTLQSALDTIKEKEEYIDQYMKVLQYEGKLDDD